MEMRKHDEGRKTCSLLLLVTAVSIVSAEDLVAAADSSSNLFCFLNIPRTSVTEHPQRY